MVDALFDLLLGQEVRHVAYGHVLIGLDLTVVLARLLEPLLPSLVDLVSTGLGGVEFL